MHKIGVLKEVIEGERRVALVPEDVKKLREKGLEVLIEKGAGEGSYFSDEEYEKEGARILSFSEIAKEADVFLKVRHPAEREGKNELEEIPDGKIWISQANILYQKELIPIFQKKKMTLFSLEMIPRTTLAQSMDILSSMATIAGYKATLLAAEYLPRFFPLLMSAAGTIKPARVFVLGAGVAGLQAIATAKRLGAVVEAFDTREVVKEQVESLGARFLQVELDLKDTQDEQGYAKELSKEFYEKEKELLFSALKRADVCITTAQIFGKKAPILITKEMVEAMKPGSVIVDLAIETGGNCELSQYNQIIDHKGVKIIALSNLPSLMAQDASNMFSHNVRNFLLHIVEEGRIPEEKEDEIFLRTRVIKKGEITSPLLKEEEKEG